MAGYTLAEVFTNILSALQDVLYYITKAIADNAQVIATVVVLGGLAYMAVTHGRRIFTSVAGFLRGLF